MIFGRTRRIDQLESIKKFADKYHKYETRGFFTPSKKVEILSKRFQDLGFDVLPVYREPAESPLGNPDLAREFPLVLTKGGKRFCYVHSQMRNIPSLRRNMPHNVAEIHPDTAGEFDIGSIDAATARPIDPKFYSKVIPTYIWGFR